MILKPTQTKDLRQLFLNQADEMYNHMAAFTSENPTDEQAYMEKWSKIIENPEINIQSIFVDDVLVGSVLYFEMMGEVNISYGIERQYWGKGYATEAAIKCKEFAFENNFADSIISIIHPDNTPSEKVALNNGMKLHKKVDGQFHGMPANIFQITRDEFCNTKPRYSL